MGMKNNAIIDKGEHNLAMKQACGQVEEMTHAPKRPTSFLVFLATYFLRMVIV